MRRRESLVAPSWLSAFAEDFDRYKHYRPGHAAWRIFLTEPALWALLQYRIASTIHRANLPTTLKRALLMVMVAWQKPIEIATGVSIAYKASIGQGLYISHGGNVFVHEAAVLGSYCSISTGMTIGITGRSGQRGVPVIGDRVRIEANAVVAGKIQVGDDAIIEANSLVVESVPPSATVMGTPAKIVNLEDSSDNISLRQIDSQGQDTSGSCSSTMSEQVEHGTAFGDEASRVKLNLKPLLNLEWRSVFKQDFDRYRENRAGQSSWIVFVTEQALWALLQYRIASAVYRSDLSSPIKRILLAVLTMWQKLIVILTGVTLPHSASIGPGVYIGHFGNIFVHKAAVVGSCCNISHGVTIGVGGWGITSGAPIIGDRVYIGVNAVVLGKTEIGNDAVIAANSLVVEDVPSFATVIGVPAKIVNRFGSRDYIAPHRRCNEERK